MDSKNSDASALRTPLRDTTNLSECDTSKLSSPISQKSPGEGNVVFEKNNSLNTSEICPRSENTVPQDLSTCTDEIYESADESLHIGPETSLSLTQLAREFENVHLSTPKSVRPGDSKSIGLLFASPAREDSPSTNSDNSSLDDVDNQSIVTTQSGDLSSHSFVYEGGEGVSKDYEGFVVPESVHTLSVDDSCERTDVLNAATFFSDSNLLAQKDSPLSANCVSGFDDSPSLLSSTKIVQNSPGRIKSGEHDDSCLVGETGDLDSPESTEGLVSNAEASVVITEEDLVQEDGVSNVNELKTQEVSPVTNLNSGTQEVTSPTSTEQFMDARLVLDEAPLQVSDISETSLLGNITVRENSLCAEDKISNSVTEQLSGEGSSFLKNDFIGSPTPGSVPKLQPEASSVIGKEEASAFENTENASNGEVLDASRCEPVDQNKTLDLLKFSFTGKEGGVDHEGSTETIDTLREDSTSLTVAYSGIGDSCSNVPGEPMLREVRENSPEDPGNPPEILTLDKNVTSPCDFNDSAVVSVDFVAVGVGDLKCQESVTISEPRVANSTITRNDPTENSEVHEVKAEESCSLEPDSDPSHQTEKGICNESTSLEKCPRNVSEIKIEVIQSQNERLENTPNDSRERETIEEEQTSALEKSYQEILETCAKQERELMSVDFSESIGAEAVSLVKSTERNGDGEPRADHDTFDDFLPPQNMMLTSLCASINTEAGPITADEDFTKEDICGSAADFLDYEFLSKIGKGKAAPQLKRKSLYVKFDPLLEKDDSFRLPEPPSTPTLENLEDANFNGDADETIGVVNTTCSLVQLTPRPDNSDSQRCSSLRKTLEQLQEEMVRREKIYELRETEAENLKLRIAELESLKNADLTGIKDKIVSRDKEIGKLASEIGALRAKNEELVNKIGGEYEVTVSKLVSENQELSAKYEKEISEIGAERDSAFQHHRNMTMSYHDVIQKFERSKEVINSLLVKEKELKKLYEETTSDMITQDEKCRKLKEHSLDKLMAANREIDYISKSHAGEMARLKAVAKKTEVHCKSLIEAVEQKRKEISELTTICDELIANS